MFDQRGNVGIGLFFCLFVFMVKYRCSGVFRKDCLVVFLLETAARRKTLFVVKWSFVEGSVVSIGVFVKEIGVW